MLSLEREQELALAWRNHSDEAALRDLIGSHLRLVIKSREVLRDTACQSRI
jgi:RNA polymerase sigma-32 factor